MRLAPQPDSFRLTTAKGFCYNPTVTSPPRSVCSLDCNERKRDPPPKVSDAEKRTPRPGRCHLAHRRTGAVRPVADAASEKAQAGAQGPDHPAGEPTLAGHHRVSAQAMPGRPEEPLVGIIMGSQSDWPTLGHAAEVLGALGIAFETRIVSAHRT